MAPGFLIAMPQLGDPNFHRSVVLMIDHNDEGSMGLVLNRAAPLKLVDLCKGQSLTVAREHAEENVFIGGPVEPFRGFVLHDCSTVAERLQVLPGLFLSVTPEALKPLLLDAGVHLRFCLGYAGWGPHQIEKEMAQGSWLFTEASTVPVLGSDPNQLWEDTVKGMGVDPAMLVMAGGIH